MKNINFNFKNIINTLANKSIVVANNMYNDNSIELFRNSLCLGLSTGSIPAFISAAYTAVTETIKTR